MSQTININGTDYSIPTSSERGWNQAVNQVLAALAELATPAEPQVGAFLSFGNSSSPNNQNPCYLTPWYQEAVAGAQTRHIVVPMAGILSHLSVRADLNDQHDDAFVWTVQVNDLDTALTVNLPEGQRQEGNAATEVSVAAGDLVSLKLKGGENTTMGVARPICTIAFTPS